MKLLTYFKKLKKPSQPPLIIRRVVGRSMDPRLVPGNVVLARSWLKRVQPGDVVIAQYQGREIIKRIERFEADKVYVVGDNLVQSTDSRHFGWLTEQDIVAKVFWPNVHNA